MNKFVRYPLVLGTVALASGLLLAGVYELTKGPIANGIIERQTSILNDMFEGETKREVLEVSDTYKNQGVTSIVKVENKGKKYNCYTIEFKDSIGGDVSTVIIALDSNNKIYKVKFVATGDSYAKRYDDKTYIATLNGKSEFTTLTGASVTAGDLNAALKIAISHASGGSVTPAKKTDIEKAFDSYDTIEELDIPSTADSTIKKIRKVTKDGNDYYAYNVEFYDSYDSGEGEELDYIKALFVLDDSSNLYKVVINSGDYYAKRYDEKDTLDTVSGATYSGQDLSAELALVVACQEEVH